MSLQKKLGINPKSLMKNVPNNSEPWKAPVGAWLREIDAKRQKKSDQKQRRKEKVNVKKSTDQNSDSKE